MGVLYTNNAKTTLSSGINNSATSISVASSSTFPSITGSNYFYATFDDYTNIEVVKVTAVSGTTWTIVRAQDDTSARAWSSGDAIELRLNVALLEDALGDAATFARDSFTGDGSETDFTLSQTASSENNLIVFIEGVFQTQSAYSLSGTTLTFSAAPADTREIIVYSTQALSAGTVITASIVDDNVTQAKIADDAVGADQLASNAVVTASIVNDNVTQAKIADDAVGADQLASSAVVTASVVDDAITTAKVADDQITLAKLAGLARGKIIYGDSSGNPAALALGSNGQVLKSDGNDIAWGTDATVAALTSEEVQDIAGAMFTSNTETGITATYEDGDGTIDLVVGTLNQDTTGTAAIATTVTITDNESTNEENAVIFTAGGDVDGGNLGLESDGNLTYNPSSGTLTATAFAGALTGNVTGNASGTAATVTTAAQTNITSLGTLTALGVDGAVIINESGNDVDFRVESDGNANMLFVDGGSNQVSIGNAGAVTGNNARLVVGDGSGSNTLSVYSGASSYSSIYFTDNTVNDYMGVVQYNHNGNYLEFYSNAAERLRFASNGAWGIAGANYGTDGQILTSTGASTAPAWEDAPSSGISTGIAIAMAIVFG